MAIFTTPEATLAYTDTGAPSANPEAQTIVFGHGLYFGSWMYQGQVEALSDTYRCIALDWRGQGGSRTSSTAYDMDTLTKDAVALIGHLGVSPVHWVGLSMGGFVGLRLGARHAHLLRSLVILNSSAELDSDEANAGALLTAASIRADGVQDLVKSLPEVLLSPSFRQSPQGPATVQGWTSRLEAADRNGLASAVEGVVHRKPVTSLLTQVSVPTLVVAGADDIAIPADFGRAIAQTVPHARFELLAGAGHGATLDQPEATTDLIRDFVESH